MLDNEKLDNLSDLVKMVKWRCSAFTNDLIAMLMVGVSESTDSSPGDAVLDVDGDRSGILRKQPLRGVAYLITLPPGTLFRYRGEMYAVCTHKYEDFTMTIRPLLRSRHWAALRDDGWSDLSLCFGSDWENISADNVEVVGYGKPEDAT